MEKPMNPKERFTKLSKYISQLFITEEDMTADVNYIYREISKMWVETSLIPNEKIEKKYVNQVISQLKRQGIIGLVSQDGRNNTYTVCNEDLMRQIESGKHKLKQKSTKTIIQYKEPEKKKVKSVKSVKSKTPSPTPYANKIRDIPLSPLEIGMGICELIGHQNDLINYNSEFVVKLKETITTQKSRALEMENTLSVHRDSILELKQGIKDMEDKISRDAKQYIAKEKQLNNQIGRLTEISLEKDATIKQLKDQPHPEIKFSSVSELSAIKISNRDQN